MTKFSQIILKARLAKGLSQVDLAKQLGVSLGSTHGWEHGQLPHPRNLPKIARLLEIDIKELAQIYVDTRLEEER